jgi:hypothetical protein
MTRSPKRSETLKPTDAPILVAGLIAARRSGDKMLATVLQRELEARFGICIRFLSDNQADMDVTHVD